MRTQDHIGKIRPAGRNPSELTLVRVTPTSWTGSGGPKEAYFLFRGTRLVDVVEVPFEDIGLLLKKGYPRNADLEVSVRPAEYKRMLSSGDVRAVRSNPEDDEIEYEVVRAINPTFNPLEVVAQRSPGARVRNLARRLAKGECG